MKINQILLSALLVSVSLDAMPRRVQAGGSGKQQTDGAQQQAGGAQQICEGGVPCQAGLPNPLSVYQPYINQGYKLGQGGILTKDGVAYYVGEGGALVRVGDTSGGAQQQGGAVYQAGGALKNPYQAYIDQGYQVDKDGHLVKGGVVYRMGEGGALAPLE